MIESNNLHNLCVAPCIAVFLFSSGQIGRTIINIADENYPKIFDRSLRSAHSCKQNNRYCCFWQNFRVPRISGMCWC